VPYYEIGFTAKGSAEFSKARLPTVRVAWAVVCTLQASNEELRYITAPDGRDMGEAELKLAAEREDRK